MHRPYILSIHTKSNRPRARIADSSSTNAVSFSSPRTTKRFPSSRCASTIEIVRIPELLCLTGSPFTHHLSLCLKEGLPRRRLGEGGAVSSVVEHLVYTESLTNIPIFSHVLSPAFS